MTERHIWLSVIVPVYKVEAYLPACIDSVACQIMPGIELILVDDGSPDNSGRICDQYREKYTFITVIHKKNGGLSDARNEGIRHAQGDYLLFLDGDDRIAGETFVRLKETMKGPESYDVIIGRYQKYYEEDHSLQECGYVLDEEHISGRGGEELLKEILFHCRHYDWYAVLNIIKKTFLLKNGLWFENGRVYEDIFWTPNVLLHSGKTGYLGYPFYVYTFMRTGAITTQVNWKGYQDKIAACQYMKEFTEKNIISASLRRKLLGSVHQIYSALIIDAVYIKKIYGREKWEELKQLLCIWKYSDKKIHPVLYIIAKCIGISKLAFALDLFFNLTSGRHVQESET